MEAAETPPEPELEPENPGRLRVDMTLPPPVGVWLQRQAADRFQSTAGYVRSIVIQLYRRDQGEPR